MKKIILMRHSIPERAEKNTEELSLSADGITLAKSKRAEFLNVDQCYSSPYKRARETAELLANHVTVVDELKERIIGDAHENFWLKQYQDYNYSNPGGESLNEVRIRMKTAIDSIIARLREGETVLIVSHATAICSYLLNYCEIEITDAAEKCRKITFAGQVILNGKFEPTGYFEIGFENNAVSSVSFHQ